MSFLSKLTIGAVAVLGAHALSKRVANAPVEDKPARKSEPTKARKASPKTASIAKRAKRSTGLGADGGGAASRQRPRKRRGRVNAKRAQT